MKPIIEVVKANPGDINILQAIGKYTFYETYSDENTKEDMNKYLAENFSRENLLSEINMPGTDFYFAKKLLKFVGYLKLNFGQSQTELKDSNGLEIERIYVLQDFHGKKIGQVLYDKALKVAKEKNAQFIWLGVWEKNPKTIRFYEKNGFVEFDKHTFLLGSDKQTDIMMKLEL